MLSGSAFRKEPGRFNAIMWCWPSPAWTCARQLQLASHKRKQTSAAPQGHCFSTLQRSVPVADRSCLSCLIEWIQPHIIESRSLSISVWHTGYWAEGCLSSPALPGPECLWYPESTLVRSWHKPLWAQSSLMLCSDGYCSTLIQLKSDVSNWGTDQVFELSLNKRRFHVERRVWFSSLLS